MPVSRRVRQSRAWRPYRTSGNSLVNVPAWDATFGGTSEISAAGPCGGCGSCGECSAMVWTAGPQQGFPMPGMGMQGGVPIGPNAVSFGRGRINPRGPKRGNMPGPMPEGEWWSGGRGPDLLPVVSRCTQVIVNSVVHPQWRVVRHGQPEPLPDLPLWLADPMLSSRSPGESQPIWPAGTRLTAWEFFTSLLSTAIWWGRSAFVFQESATGQPLAGTLRLINPWLIDTDGAGRWYLDAFGDDRLATDHDGRFEIGGKVWRLAVLRNMPPHDGGGSDFLGGVMVRHASTFGLGCQIESAAETIFHSQVPTGILTVSTPNVSREQAEGLKRAFVKAHSGDHRSVAVMNSQVSYQPISWAPHELQLNEIRRATWIEAAWAFNLDPGAILGVSDSSLTYSNVSQQGLAMIRQTLSGYAAGLMGLLSSVLPAGQRLEMDWAGLVSTDFETAAPVVQSLVQSGLLSVDEGRSRLGYGPAQPQSSASTPAELARIAQMSYLAAGKTLSPSEIRSLLREAGMDIPLEPPTDATAAILVKQEAVDLPNSVAGQQPETQEVEDAG